MKHVFLLLLFLIITSTANSYGFEEEKRLCELQFETDEQHLLLGNREAYKDVLSIVRDELVSDGIVREFYVFKNLDIKGFPYHTMKIKKEMNFKNSKQEGMTIEYYRDGKVKSIQNYKDGKQHGITKEYYLNGSLRSEASYENGKIMLLKTHDKTGKVINKKAFDINGKVIFDINYSTK